MLITDNEALSQFCQTLHSSDILFLDTEFVREKTYFSMLCLIQLAGREGEVAAIDVLAPGIDMTPLLDILYDKNKLKVVHSGRQDMEIFYGLRGDVPKPLFDTQVAAMIMGHGEQMGYEGMVRHYLGEKLDKAQQYTDWAKRPLTDKQLDYAIDDVRCLRLVYPLLVEELANCGRLAWVEQESAYLYNLALYMQEPEEAWKRIRRKGEHPHYLARLQELAAWREREAKRRNVSRGKILSDDIIQEIALTNPRNDKAVARLRGISGYKISSDMILTLVERANRLTRDQCPQLEQRKLLPKKDDITRDALKLLLKVKAQSHNITPSMIADAEALQAVIDGVESHPVMEGWRYEMFGQDAQRFLKGELGLQMQRQEMRIIGVNPAV